jgi:hypothetical protein
VAAHAAAAPAAAPSAAASLAVARPAAAPRGERRAGAAATAIPAIPSDLPAAKPVTAGLTLAAAFAAPRPAAGTPGAELAVRLGRGDRESATTVLAVARHDGDWNCSGAAMKFLAHQLRERTGMALMASDVTVRLDDPGLARLPFVYFTGNAGFRLTEAEVRGLRAYLQGGGFLWADDSSDFSDEAFDPAFRREIARVLPGAAIERLERDFAACRTGYDLSAGYRGYALPPGDKYRLDYLEGIRVGSRVAVVYTRNDYGDGLNIDPHTSPIMPSLTDLSPAEMQEGATRMGINLVFYFLERGGRVNGEFAAGAARTLRAGRDAAAAAPPQGASRPWRELLDTAGWFAEAWGEPGRLAADRAGLAIAFGRAETNKTAFGRMCDPPLALERGDALLVDVESRLRCGARMAVGLTVGARYFESEPFYVKPGRNTVFFRCDARTFKSEAAHWEYRDTLPAPLAAAKLNLLVYAPAAGEMTLANARVVRTR